MYQLIDNGGVGVFAHGREKKLLAEPDMDDAVQSTPAAAHGVLFIATKSRLFDAVFRRLKEA